MARPGYENYFDEEEAKLNEQQERESPISSRENDNQQPSHRYRLADDAGPIHPSCHLTEAQIHKVIDGRRGYQRTRQFSKADQLLQGLNRAGVFVHDKRQEWRADGLKSFGQSASSRYVRRGGNPTTGQLEQGDLNQITLLVEKRSQAKKQRNFRKCDQLEAQLSRDYKVQIDDKRREWSFLASSSTAKEYVPSPLAADDDLTHTMDEEMKSQIQQLLRDRVVARQSKDYKTADGIRDALLETHGVVIDDRTREWKVVSDWDDESDPFVVDALASQRSAFARKNSQRQSIVRTAKVVHELSLAATDSQENLDEDFSHEINADSSTTTTTDVDTPQDDEATLTTLTVVALKEKLRVAGLPVSGKKAELVDRLLSA